MKRHFSLSLICAAAAAFGFGAYTIASASQGDKPTTPVRPGTTRSIQPATLSFDPAALAAVAGSKSADFGLPLTSAVQLYTVPAGKRLVIENLSCMATTHPGVHLHGSVGTRLGQSTCNTQVVIESVGTGENYRRHAMNHSVRLYADAGTNVTFTIQRSGANSQGGYTVSFSGYLVDKP